MMVTSIKSLGRLLAMCFLVGVGATAGQAQMTSDLDSLLAAPDLPAYKWFASTDPKHQNDDFLMLKPGESKKIPLAAGLLERLWSTSLAPEKLDLTLELAPNQRLPILVSGDAKLGLYVDRAYTYIPGSPLDPGAKLAAGAALIGTNRAKESVKWYYQVSIRPEKSGPVPAIPKVQDIAFTRLSPVVLGAGEEKSLQTWNEPGMIYEFQAAVTDGPPAAMGDLHLKAAWEGKVAVDASLLGLAGQMSGNGLVQNAVSDYDGTALTLKWPMPFTKAQLWLRNEGSKTVTVEPSVRIRRYSKEPTRYRFCALQRSSVTERDKPVEILRVNGQGAFVGLALNISPAPESNALTFAYLEGNETMEADGVKYEGTGNEDFFSSSWYYPDKPFYLPYHGMVEKKQKPPSVASYRFLIPDPLPFKKSFEMQFEHGRKNNRPGLQWNYVAFWYQKEPAGNEVAGAAGKGSNGVESPLLAKSNLPIWLAPVAGIVVGVLLYLAKRPRRARERNR